MSEAERSAVTLAGRAAYSLDRNPFLAYLARLAPVSRPTMAEALERMARLGSGGALTAEGFPWHLLRYSHVQAIRTALLEAVSPRTGKQLSPASVNKFLCALRGVLKEAWRLGYMSAEELARATDVEPVRGARPLAGRALSTHEIARLFHVCQTDTTPAGPRDAVIFALGLGAGLRRAEIVGLDLAEIDLEGETVRVQGKGGKVRDVPIKGGTLEAIRAWLEHRAAGPGSLLCPVRKGGRLELRRLTAQAVLRVCEKRGGEAGIPGFVAHDLRRTYISALLDRGVDLSVASGLAGHSNPGTTQRYDRRGERAMHAAAEAIVVPYTRS